MLKALVRKIENIGHSRMSKREYLLEVVDLLPTNYRAERSVIDRFRSQLS